jgi:hypothetical protein
MAEQAVGIFQHTWLRLYDGSAIHVVGPCFFALKHGLATVLGFIGF